jgi:beta-N-acetylhexosaminidase
MILLRPLALSLLLALTACAQPEAPADSAPLDDALPAQTVSALDTLLDAYDVPGLQPARMAPDRAQAWADSVLATLSTSDKAGQVILANLPSSGGVDGIVASASQLVERTGVTGFLVGRLLPPEDVFAVTRALQQAQIDAGRPPLLFAADYERGVGRFSNAFTELPSNMAIGATRDPAYAAAAGRLSAIESRAVGVRLLFAPVADVNNNPGNPIINIRSYGERPELVADMVAAYVQAAEAAGVGTTLKHFPGHGNTTTDTHSSMATVGGERADLDATELRPFREAFESSSPTAVMTAHLWVPALDEVERPATFSPVVLTDLLRGELGFDGVVVTDDVRMGALQNDFELAERVVTPLLAGADLILTPRDVSAAARAITSALSAGTLSADRLDEAARRILTAKARLGLPVDAVPSQEAFDYVATRPLGQSIADAIARDAATLLRASDALPLAPGTDVLALHLSNYTGSTSIEAARDELNERLRAAGLDVTSRYSDSRASPPERDRFASQIESADVIVVGLYLRLVSGRGNAGLLPGQAELVQTALDSGKPVVLLAFGNPYAVLAFPDADAKAVFYDPTVASTHAAADLLLGKVQAPGRLPITVGEFAFGE